jgi:hypothetical protein
MGVRIVADEVIDKALDCGRVEHSAAYTATTNRLFSFFPFAYSSLLLCRVSVAVEAVAAAQRKPTLRRE